VEEEFPTSDVPVGPDDVEDAGPDTRIDYSTRNGFRLWKAARAAFARAVVATMLSSDPQEVAATMRAALSKVTSASYWLAHTPWLSDVHFDMDRMGEFRRETLPGECSLHWTGAGYENRCPVAIAHKRFGFSIGMVVPRKECSLCSQDISECPHLPGRLYRVRGGVDGSPTGACRVCGGNACGHSSDITYLAVRVAVIKDVSEHKEVSLVSDPKQPDARLTAVPVPMSSLRNAFGDFPPGMPINCDKCVQRCTGFTYMPAPDAER
jgi:hypothetical protein